MIKELKYVFYIIIIFFFIFFISRYYFSDEYKKKSYRSLNLIDDKINIFSKKLVILENDTNNIIEYVEYQKDKNKKKYHFWELLKMINKRRSFITGIKGTKLSQKEIIFLKKYKPWGIILFSRNIKSISQTQKLTSHIKKLFNDKNYPILIDEEGGRVSRLNKFIDNSIFFCRIF